MRLLLEPDPFYGLHGTIGAESSSVKSQIYIEGNRKYIEGKSIGRFSLPCIQSNKSSASLISRVSLLSVAKHFPIIDFASTKLLMQISSSYIDSQVFLDNLKNRHFVMLQIFKTFLESRQNVRSLTNFPNEIRESIIHNGQKFQKMSHFNFVIFHHFFSD